MISLKLIAIYVRGSDAGFIICTVDERLLRIRHLPHSGALQIIHPPTIQENHLQNDGVNASKEQSLGPLGTTLPKGKPNNTDLCGSSTGHQSDSVLQFEFEDKRVALQRGWCA